MSTDLAPSPAAPLPFWLRGPFAPVRDEITAHALVVEGELPRDLDGFYLRNGPNPKDGVSPHWWFGDGMIHGIRLCQGQASWYRNRYVRTARFTGQQVGPEGDSAEAVRARRLRGGGSSNTNVIAHGGRLLSLVEAALPVELGRDLSTAGVYDFGGALDRPMTAHPKVCPTTGELHFYSYQLVAPYLTYYVADRAGRIVASQELEVSGPSLMHDFALTEKHAVFFDSPARMTRDWGQGMPFTWSEDAPARIGVVARPGATGRARAGADIRWFSFAPGHLGHTTNAFERGTTIVLEGVRYERFEASPPRLHRWEMDLVTGRTREYAVDADLPVEFPRIDERRTGLEHRHTYAIAFTDLVDGVPTGADLRRYDHVGGTWDVADLDGARAAGEPVFVPRDAQGDGWILSLVCDDGRGGSELSVWDSDAFASPPIAKVRLPRRVPFGFHGSWVPAAALAGP